MNRLKIFVFFAAFAQGSVFCGGDGQTGGAVSQEELERQQEQDLKRLRFSQALRRCMSEENAIRFERAFFAGLNFRRRVCQIPDAALEFSLQMNGSSADDGIDWEQESIYSPWPDFKAAMIFLAQKTPGAARFVWSKLMALGCGVRKISALSPGLVDFFRDLETHYMNDSGDDSSVDPGWISDQYSSDEESDEQSTSDDEPPARQPVPRATRTTTGRAVPTGSPRRYSPPARVARGRQVSFVGGGTLPTSDSEDS